MTSRWQWLLKQLGRRLWFRAGLLSLLAVATAMLAIVIEPLIPSGLPTRIGADAVDDILNILATSMLAVTTFSLTTMVSAYGAATNNVTPRATKLLIEDPTSQNVLATFVGSFLYGLVGIITLSTGAYGDEGRVVLFFVTIGVIALIVVTLLGWIDHLATLGRVGETTDRVERAVSKAVAARIENPYLGGRRLADPDRDVPAAARPLYSPRIGYVQYVDVESLSDCAEEHGGEIYVVSPPGAFVEPSRPLAWLHAIAGERVEKRIRSAFEIDDERSFDQDPRFGLSVLAEIASRALSPAVNDAGTAIDVIGRSVRVLSIWADSDSGERNGAADRGADGASDGAAGERGEVRCPRIFVPPIEVGDLFDDAFWPIGRDGASVIEVQVRLQKALLTLSKIGGTRFAEHAARHARLALERAERALELEEEKERVRTIAAATLSQQTASRERVAAKSVGA
ncbi:MAG: DUF2254 domain-containing protein [Gammaproteobacteria bacterium]|nr:DUF2254 domain-containing protein [Gammaproteobacteria bacterium]